VPPAAPTIWIVRCEATREALSAQLDGEDDAYQRDAVDAHLAGCAACRGWLDAAAQVTRLARTSTAAAVPLRPEALAAILAAAPGRGRARLALTLRTVLGVLGGVQLLLALASVLAIPSGFGHEHRTVDGATPNHLWHESAAWNVAIGAGFLWIALRRTRPNGLVPTLTAFIAVLTLLSAVDVAEGRVEPVRLVSHGLILAGYLIILALTRPALHTGDPRPDRQPGTPRYHVRPDDLDASADVAAGSASDTPAARAA
jgi:predicted anti-sigma-YlaC factor YlaD